MRHKNLAVQALAIAALCWPGIAAPTKDPKAADLLKRGNVLSLEPEPKHEARCQVVQKGATKQFSILVQAAFQLGHCPQAKTSLLEHGVELLMWKCEVVRMQNERRPPVRINFDTRSKSDAAAVNEVLAEVFFSSHFDCKEPPKIPSVTVTDTTPAEGHENYARAPIFGKKAPTTICRAWTTEERNPKRIWSTVDIEFHKAQKESTCDKAKSTLTSQGWQITKWDGQRAGVKQLLRFESVSIYRQAFREDEVAALSQDLEKAWPGETFVCVYSPQAGKTGGVVKPIKEMPGSSKVQDSTSLSAAWRPSNKYKATCTVYKDDAGQDSKFALFTDIPFRAQLAQAGRDNLEKAGWDMVSWQVSAINRQIGVEFQTEKAYAPSINNDLRKMFPGVVLDVQCELAKAQHRRSISARSSPKENPRDRQSSRRARAVPEGVTGGLPANTEGDGNGGHVTTRIGTVVHPQHQVPTKHKATCAVTEDENGKDATYLIETDVPMSSQLVKDAERKVRRAASKILRMKSEDDREHIILFHTSKGKDDKGKDNENIVVFFQTMKGFEPKFSRVVRKMFPHIILDVECKLEKREHARSPANTEVDGTDGHVNSHIGPPVPRGVAFSQLSKEQYKASCAVMEDEEDNGATYLIKTDVPSRLVKTPRANFETAVSKLPEKDRRNITLWQTNTWQAVTGNEENFMVLFQTKAGFEPKLNKAVRNMFPNIELDVECEHKKRENADD